MSSISENVQLDQSFTDYLEFEYLEIADYQVDIAQAMITIKVINLEIMDQHPRYATLADSDEYLLIFKGVTQSQRRISIYKDGDVYASVFASKDVHDDLFTADATNQRKAYFVGGVLRQPPAWLGWDIIAADYEITLPK